MVRDIHVKPNKGGHMDLIVNGMEKYREAFELLSGDRYEGLATIEHWRSQEGNLRGISELKAVVESL
jgi:hypothetical protein